MGCLSTTFTSSSSLARFLYHVRCVHIHTLGGILVYLLFLSLFPVARSLTFSTTFGVYTLNVVILLFCVVRLLGSVETSLFSTTFDVYTAPRRMCTHWFHFFRFGRKILTGQDGLLIYYHTLGGILVYLLFFIFISCSSLAHFFLPRLVCTHQTW